MDVDRQRGERYGDCADYQRNPHPATSPWASNDPNHHYDGKFDNQRGGFSGDGHHHPRPHYFDPNSNHFNHRHQNFNSEQNEGDFGSGHLVPLTGRKRPFTNRGQGASPDCSFVKLYVGGISKAATEEEIHSLFEQYGSVVEVVLVKDKGTGQQQEFCFVKYTKLEEADRAIGALNKQYTFHAGGFPIKVRYAEGERERLGIFAVHEHNHKLYVGSLNKQASKREVEEIFSAYGLVEDIYIVVDDLKQSRGCGFVQFSQRDMAVAAMNALGGSYIMRGCNQPLIVRFATPKKPRMGESRSAPYFNDPMTGQLLPNCSLPLSPKTMISSSQSPGTGRKPQSISSKSIASEPVWPSSTSSAAAVSLTNQIADSLDCDWSEHTCPDGYKYYYNCVTFESRWEKP